MTGEAEKVAEAINRLYGDIASAMHQDDSGAAVRAYQRLGESVAHHLPLILRHLRAGSDAAVERAAEAMSMNNLERWPDADEAEREMWRDDARVAIRAAVSACSVGSTARGAAGSASSTSTQATNPTTNQARA